MAAKRAREALHYVAEGGGTASLRAGTLVLDGHPAVAQHPESFDDVGAPSPKAEAKAAPQAAKK